MPPGKESIAQSVADAGDGSLARANLDFLLYEMQLWGATNRIPGPMLLPLLREYRSRRDALDAPAPSWVASLDLPALSPVPTSAPPPAPPVAAPLPERPTKSAWSVVTEFLEERNIAALHIVGSLLLLTGLLVMMRWEWGVAGRALLLTALGGMSGGLSWSGRKMGERDTISGMILSALGALILPIALSAARLYGFLGGALLNAEASAALIAGICAATYTITLRRTRHPLFGGLFALAVSVAATLLPRAFLPATSPLLPLMHALTLLPLSYVFFQYAATLRRRDEIALSHPFALAGHTLIALTFALTFLNGRGDAHHWTQALIATVASLIYADIAVRLRLPRLTYAAAVGVVLASQLPFGVQEQGMERGCAAAFAAFALQLLNAGYARMARRATEEVSVLFQEAARIYGQAALLVSAVLLPLFFVAALFPLFTFTLTHSALERVQTLCAAALLGVVFLWQGWQNWQENNAPQRVFVYPAIAALFVAISALMGLASWLMPALASGMTPALCGLILVLLCQAAAQSSERRGVFPLSDIFAEAARGATLISCVLPFAHLTPLLPQPDAARWMNMVFVLPCLAMLSGSIARRSADAQRDACLRLLTFSLGSLSLYIGESAMTLSLELRLLYAALGGGLMALTLAMIGALFAPIRRIFSQEAALLAAFTALPLIGSAAFAVGDNAANTILARAGIALILALSWGVLARTRRETALLYGLGVMTLLAVAWAGRPLENLIPAPWNAAVNPGRWFLYVAPLFALTAHTLRLRRGKTPPDYAAPLFHSAFAAAALGGAMQAGMILFSAFASSASAGELSAITHLYLLTIGLMIAAVIERRVRFVYTAFAPLIFAYAFCLLRFWPQTQTAPLWQAVLTLFITGGGALYIVQTGREINPLPAAQIGAFALLAGAAQLLSLLLPLSAHYVWAILLLPLLGLLSYWNQGMLKETLCAMAIAILALFALDLLRWQTFAASLPMAQGFLAATVTLYTALLMTVALRESRRDWFQAALFTATIGFLGWRSGFPVVTMPAERIGVYLATIGGVWFGIGRLMASRPAFATILDSAALTLTTVAAACGFLTGIIKPDAEGAALTALLISGGILTALAYHRPRTSRKHLAFLALFLAFLLYLNRRLGFSTETMDLFALPLGLYLLSLGVYGLYRCRSPRISRSETAETGTPAHREDDPQTLCALGLSFLLGSSLLSVFLAGNAWWHPFLLVTECLMAIAVGIAYRLKLFLGFGFGFLIALLAFKAYQAIQVPGQQLLFALYLLLLGALALAAGVFFDRRHRRKE